MVYGLWFMVYGLWFMVYGLWFIAYILGCRFEGAGACCTFSAIVLWSMSYDLGFMVHDLWCMMYGSWSIVQGLGCRCLLRLLDQRSLRSRLEPPLVPTPNTHTQTQTHTLKNTFRAWGATGMGSDMGLGILLPLADSSFMIYGVWNYRPWIIHHQQ